MRTAASATDLEELLSYAGTVMDEGVVSSTSLPLRVGVDLGTAFTVVIATDESGWPVAGAYEFANVIRDGVVVDFHGATKLLRRLVDDVEERMGRPIEHAASGFPPGVPRAEVQAVEHVLEAAGVTCTALIDEPTAANAVLGIRDGAVVDVGGGTTGVAVFADGKVVHVADEPTGGTHVTLVLAGALGVSFHEAEQLKRDPSRAKELMAVVRPVFEKIGTIAKDIVAGHDVDHLYLVGGTCRFPDMAEVISASAGIPATVPGDPIFVTALGLAAHDVSSTGGH